MLEPRDQPAPRVSDGKSLTDRLANLPGLAQLVAEAESTWRARAEAAGEAVSSRPGWRAFEDSFPTFYEFTNRPR
ncbi:MAG: hypothetical protein QOE61_1293 [Micromonosporaceae bacterium]|jgi:hypothetical protein|nr:hypothetical protein [Micromonosporaceae bacterium]